MGNKCPLQTPREVQTNLTALGFSSKRTKGSHEQWERPGDHILPRKLVTVDLSHRQFSIRLMKWMIDQSGFSQQEFCTGVMNAERLKAAPPIPTAVPEPSKKIG
jgi:predicted RNA binding protein YcfA (HicA-like mRNA interferase family)